MSIIGDMFGIGGGDDVGGEIIAASQPAVGAQGKALQYLRQRERVPQRYRERALGELWGEYKRPINQQRTIRQALKSPLYGAIMGGQEAGEEAILRSAAATGGLRSGNVQENLYDYNTQLQNQALLQSYNAQLGERQTQMQGLGGLAGLPSLAPQIAQGIAGIGQTQSQAQIAAAQAGQTGQQQGFGNLLGLGQLGLSAYQSGMFSDRRLKTNTKLLGQDNGFNIYSWDWNMVAQQMGLTGNTVGCMADEVYYKRPDAVSIKDLFMFVHYDKLNVLVGV